MNEETIKTLLDRIAQSNEEKEAVLEWVIHKLVCQCIDSKVPPEFRRKNIHEIIDLQLDRWCE